MPGNVSCYCATYRCNGKLITYRAMNRHVKEDITKLKKQEFAPQKFLLNEFDNIIDPNIYENHWSAREKLSSSSNKTVLETVFEIMKDFVFTPMHTKGYVSTRLSSYRDILPSDSRLPNSYKEAVKVIEPFLVPLHRFDVCPNDCIIFRKDYRDLSHCPVCHSNRFDLDGKPIRKFTYLPITPRIRRMIANKTIRDLLDGHKYASETERQSDFHHSKVWNQEYFGQSGQFCDTDTGISLTLCLDGVNPFKQVQIDYSMWPVELSIDNFPQNIRKSSAGILICGIIPANNKKEPKSLEPYMELLVDELLSLENCRMLDYNGKPVSVSVKLLRYVLDFPAIGKTLHLPGSARSIRACPFCQTFGKSCCANKTLFLDNRRFLDPDHSFRQNAEGFPNNFVETRDAPEKPFPAEKLRTLRSEYDKIESKSGKLKFTREFGVRGCYSFMKLNYHQFQHQLGPDPMHTIKNAVKNLCQILNGSVASIENVQNEFGSQSCNLPLSSEEIEQVNKNLSTVIYPANATGCRHSFLTEVGKVHPTHAWHEYAGKNVMLYSLKDIRDGPMKKSILFWLSTINRLVRYSITQIEIEQLKKDQYLASCLLEKYFPLQFHLISSHMLLHDCEAAEKFGPAHGRWMFFYERLNSLIIRRALDRSDPESCAINTLRIMDWVNDVVLAKRLNGIKSPNVDDEKCQGGKRKRETTMNGLQVKEIVAQLNCGQLENLNIKEMKWYQVERNDGYNVIKYQTHSNIENETKKSSRFVYVNKYKRFGEIMKIFEHFEKQVNYVWFEVNLYSSHQIDQSTHLPYVDQTEERTRCVVPPTELGDPLIVSIDGCLVWFISVEHDSRFAWLSELSLS